MRPYRCSSSAYVAHAYKLLTDEFETVPDEIHVVGYFYYSRLYEIRINVATLYVIGHHEISVVDRRLMIAFARWPIARTWHLIGRLHKIRVLLSLMLKKLRLARVLFVTPLTALRCCSYATDRLAESRIRQSRDVGLLVTITRWQCRARMILHYVSFSLAAALVDLRG